MTGCSAPGCTNRSENGIQMKKLPRDPERRAEWISRVKRSGGVVTNSFFLCEDHFSEKQWEKPRQDGKQKLKVFAVPDILPTLKTASQLFEEWTAKFNNNVTDDMVIEVKDGSQGMTSQDVVQDLELHEVEDNDIDETLEILQLDVTENEVIPVQRKHVRFENTKSMDSELDRVSKCAERLRKEVSKLCNDVEILQTNEEKFEEVFMQDQLDVICQRPRDGFRWSDMTVKNALKLYFACGVVGYRELLEQKLPFPSEDDFKQYIQKQGNSREIFSDIFRLLECKVCHLDDTVRNSVLIIDEVGFKCNNLIYAMSSESNRYAVFTVRSLTGLWQQVVGHHVLLVESSVWISKYLISNIIDRAEEINLRIYAVTLNGCERFCHHVLKAFGIGCTRTSVIINHTRNSYDPLRKIYFLVNIRCVAEHLINNLNSVGNMIFSKELIILYKLPSCSISAKHINVLADDAEMTTGTDTRQSDSNWISWVAEAENYHKMLKTLAWFKDFCNRWLQLMSVGDPVFGLTQKKPEEYKETINFLYSVIDVFKNIRLGNDGGWKPIQSEIVVTTQSVLDVQEFVLDTKHQNIFLTSAVTTGRLGLQNKFASMEELVVFVKSESLKDFLHPITNLAAENNTVLLEHHNCNEVIDKLAYFR